jgi:hypothetical protein
MRLNESSVLYSGYVRDKKVQKAIKRADTEAKAKQDKVNSCRHCCEDVVLAVVHV